MLNVMLRQATLILIAGCMLCACAFRPAPQPSLAGMQWILLPDEGDGVKLAFGVPNSDDVLLMLSCPARSGEVDLTVIGSSSRPVRRLHAQSAGTRVSLPAKTISSDLHDKLIVAKAPASSQLFTSFAGTGELALGVDTNPSPYPSADRTSASRFVRSCRA